MRRGPDDSAAAPEKPAPSIPEKPSIAVLPFTNMSGDPEQDYFADGMAEDITTALSKVRWFFSHIAQFGVHLQSAKRSM